MSSLFSHHQSSPVRTVLMSADCVGGVWTYALELAQALAACEVEVVLAVMGGPLSAQQRREAATLSNLELFESRWKLEWMPEPWEEVAAAGQWLLELESAFRPQVVHLNGYAHGALPWKAPVLVAGHSCVLSWWRAVRQEKLPDWCEPYRRKVRTGVQAATEVVAPSQCMLSALNELYGPLPRTRVIYNGRRLPKSPAAPKENLILSAGRLWDEAKNISLLVSLAPELSWPLYLAGDPGPRPAGAEPVQGVHFLGQLGSSALLEWMNRAGIYAQPARYEPFGLSVLEAALCGCALVLSDIPSLRELWNSAALFVPEGEPRLWTDTLQYLCRHAQERTLWGRRARQMAGRYTRERMGAAYMRAYNAAAGRAASLDTDHSSIACAS